MRIEDFADHWMKEHRIAWGAASKDDIVKMVKDVLSLPRYTEDLNEAWGMLEALKDMDPDVRATVSWDSLSWNCTISKGDLFSVSSGETVAKAISSALHHWKDGTQR